MEILDLALGAPTVLGAHPGRRHVEHVPFAVLPAPVTGFAPHLGVQRAALGLVTAALIGTVGRAIERQEAEERI